MKLIDGSGAGKTNFAKGALDNEFAKYLKETYDGEEGKV